MSDDTTAPTGIDADDLRNIPAGSESAIDAAENILRETDWEALRAGIRQGSITPEAAPAQTDTAKPAPASAERGADGQDVPKIPEAFPKRTVREAWWIFCACFTIWGVDELEPGLEREMFIDEMYWARLEGPDGEYGQQHSVDYDTLDPTDWELCYMVQGATEADVGQIIKWLKHDFWMHQNTLECYEFLAERVSTAATDNARHLNLMLDWERLQTGQREVPGGSFEGFRDRVDEYLRVMRNAEDVGGPTTTNVDPADIGQNGAFRQHNVDGGGDACSDKPLETDSPAAEPSDHPSEMPSVTNAGPLSSLRFSWDGKVYDMQFTPWKLLSSMWGQDTRDINEVELETWGEKLDIPVNIGPTLKRVNDTLKKAGHPKRLQRKKDTIRWGDWPNT